MDDLISRQAAIKALCENGVCETEKCNVIHCKDREAIEHVPSIDPVKHGKWFFTTTDIPKFSMNVCSECGFQYPFLLGVNFNYCPNCGADMRGE